MNRLLFFLSMLTSFVLTAQQVTIDTVIVKPYKSVQNYEHFRRLVINASDNEIEFLKDYEFEWGIEKTILVETTRLKNTLSDGTRCDHTYLKTVSERKMDSTDTFLVYLTGELYYGGDQTESQTLEKLEEGKYRYFDEVNIIIPNQLNVEIKKIKDNQSKKRGFFVFVDPETIRLVGFKN